MSVIVFIICLISCIASIIGYLRRKYKWSKYKSDRHDVHKLHHYDKRSPYDIYINITLVVVYMNQPLIMYINYLLDKTRIGITNKEGSMITFGIAMIGMIGIN